MGVGFSTINRDYSQFLNKTNNNVFANFENNSTTGKHCSCDECSFSSSFEANYTSENKVEKNKGIFYKLLSICTGKDYYKTSSGVKIVTERHHGAVYENEEGQIFAHGLSNAKIRGTKGNDTIVVTNSSVGTIKGRKGDDNIIVENSTIANIKGGRGQDNIIGINSKLGKVEGGTGDDTIITENTSVLELNGNWGRDTIVTEGGSVDKLKTSLIDDVNIFENPLNPNPDDEYTFR